MQVYIKILQKPLDISAENSYNINIAKRLWQKSMRIYAIVLFF